LALNNTFSFYRWKSIQKQVKNSKKVAAAATELVLMAKEISQDQDVLSEISGAIERNNAVFGRVAAVERSLCSNFSEMLKNAAANDEENSTSIGQELKMIDLRNYARNLIGLAKKFCQEMEPEYSDLSNVLVELEDFVNVVVRVLEKIEELGYRVQLADFLGKLGGDPNQDAVHALLQETLATVGVNEAVRHFANVFNAYQQFLFPYGGTKVGLLRQIHEQVAEKSRPEEKVEVLRTEYRLVQNDLNEMEQTAKPEIDEHVRVTLFDSEGVVTRPFFIWTGTRYGQTIKKLLNCEQVGNKIYFANIFRFFRVRSFFFLNLGVVFKNPIIYYSHYGYCK